MDVRAVTAVRGETYEPSDVSSGERARGLSALSSALSLTQAAPPAPLQDSFALVDALNAASTTTWLDRPPVM